MIATACSLAGFWIGRNWNVHEQSWQETLYDCIAENWEATQNPDEKDRLAATLVFLERHPTPAELAHRIYPTNGKGF